MPELRQNYFTKEWVIIATDRAKRPEEMVKRRAGANRSAPHVEIAFFAQGMRARLRRKSCGSRQR